MAIKSDKAFDIVFMGILIVSLIGATWTGIQTSMSSVNTSGLGGAIIVLVPLLLAFAIVRAIYKNSQ